ncbi:ornithine carbamoyltransferase [Candidatus Micrarchaeota archaeon]|nr:ornithine carbamoyltransferase [Candidatus Micrarchaeota archaeon]
MKNLLSIKEISKADADATISRAVELKKERKPLDVLKGKTLAMLFEKPSTRTRISFEVAMAQLGGRAMYLDFTGMQISRGESIADTARVMSRYVDAVMLRLYKHSDLAEFAKNSTVPVINGLTDLEHPCQALGDLLTIREKGKKGGKFVFVGDCANNMANSLMLACARDGMSVTLCCPPGYPLNKEYVQLAQKTGSKIEVETNPLKAAKNADVLYSDVWVSMGMEEEKAERMKAFSPYQINSDMLKQAKKDCIVMHCLPAHRGLEITSDALDSKNSVVWDEAENRLHIQKAILLELLAK